MRVSPRVVTTGSKSWARLCHCSHTEPALAQGCNAATRIVEELLIILAVLCVFVPSDRCKSGDSEVEDSVPGVNTIQTGLKPSWESRLVGILHIWSFFPFTTNSSVLSKCVSFLLLLHWASINTVALDNEIQCSLFCRSDRQTMQVSLGGNSSVHRAQFLLKALERNFSQVLESTYIPWFMASSSIFKNIDIPLANFSSGATVPSKQTASDPRFKVALCVCVQEVWAWSLYTSMKFSRMKN